MYSESKYLVSWRVMTSLWPSWLSRVVHLIYSRISAVPSDDKYFAKSEQSSWVYLQKRRLLTTEIWCRPSIFMFTENEQQCFRIMLVAMRAPQIAGLSCQGAHSHISLQNDTLLWNVSGKYSQSWHVCVCCWRTGSIWCTHIPVTYKYCMVYVVTFWRAEYNAVLPPITLSE